MVLRLYKTVYHQISSFFLLLMLGLGIEDRWLFFNLFTLSCSSLLLYGNTGYRHRHNFVLNVKLHLHLLNAGPWLTHFYLILLLQLDSATSLIQAAKNLMNAVVLTVKASYVASTKYQKVYGTAAVNSPVVSWKMKAPEKKPLVKREKPEEFQTRVRRGSQKKHISPVQALSEFKAMDSF